MPLSFPARPLVLRVRSKLLELRGRSGQVSLASPADCVAQCENMLSIDQAQLDLAAGPRGVLDSAALRNVVRAIGYVIESTCEPL